MVFFTSATAKQLQLISVSRDSMAAIAICVSMTRTLQQRRKDILSLLKK
jgi:hypothetical protein